MSSEKDAQDLIPDKPLTDPSEDQFGRDQFAKRVAEVLMNKQTPDHLTVGIYGKWGEGKTSLIYFIKYYLENDYENQAIHLDFNPWRYKDEEQLLNSFFKQFAQGVSYKLKENGTKLAKTLLAYSGLIVAIAEPVTGLSMFSSMGGWDTVKNYGVKAKNFISDNDFSPAISSLEKTLRNSESLEKQKNTISEQLRETGKKYIVFIDDIDRLDNREIQILFSLIKVTADFDNVIYVLCFDPKIVSKALGDSYSEAGRSFLEKIIQVPLNLPKARRTDVFNELLYPGLTSHFKSFNFALTGEEMSMIADSIINGLESKIDTPRLVKRFLNAVNFALPILRDESYVHDVIMVEGLRICYPEVYDYVFKNRELFISNDSSKYYKSDEEEKKERAIVDEYLKDKNESLSNLLSSIFPRYQEGNFDRISNDELATLQCVASPEYFERYFTYSIPKYDLADTSFAEFMSGLTSNTIQDSVRISEKLINTSSEDLFLRKLEQRIYGTNFFSRELIEVLARLGSNVSKRLNLLNLNTPIKRVANLIKELIKRLPKDNQLVASKEGLRNSTNIILTAEIGRKLHKSANKEPLFTDSEEKEIVELVAELIKKDAEDNGAFYLRKDVKMSSPLLFNLWTYSPNEREVENFIVNSFNKKSTNVLEFLKAFSPLRGVDENEKFHFGLFEADQYTKVKRLVSPKVIYDILIQDYESVMKDSGGINDFFFEGEIEGALAKSFAHYFKRDEDFKKSE